MSKYLDDEAIRQYEATVQEKWEEADQRLQAASNRLASVEADLKSARAAFEEAQAHYLDQKAERDRALDALDWMLGPVPLSAELRSKLDLDVLEATYNQLRCVGVTRLHSGLVSLGIDSTNHPPRELAMGLYRALGGRSRALGLVEAPNEKREVSLGVKRIEAEPRSEQIVLQFGPSSSPVVLGSTLYQKARNVTAWEALSRLSALRADNIFRLLLAPRTVEEQRQAYRNEKILRAGGSHAAARVLSDLEVDGLVVHERGAHGEFTYSLASWVPTGDLALLLRLALTRAKGRLVPGPRFFLIRETLMGLDNGLTGTMWKESWGRLQTDKVIRYTAVLINSRPYECAGEDYDYLVMSQKSDLQLIQGFRAKGVEWRALHGQKGGAEAVAQPPTGTMWVDRRKGTSKDDCLNDTLMAALRLDSEYRALTAPITIYGVWESWKAASVELRVHGVRTVRRILEDLTADGVFAKSERKVGGHFVYSLHLSIPRDECALGRWALHRVADGRLDDVLFDTTLDVLKGLDRGRWGEQLTQTIKALFKADFILPGKECYLIRKQEELKTAARPVPVGIGATVG